MAYWDLRCSRALDNPPPLREEGLEVPRARPLVGGGSPLHRNLWRRRTSEGGTWVLGDCRGGGVGPRGPVSLLPRGPSGGLFRRGRAGGGGRLRLHGLRPIYHAEWRGLYGGGLLDWDCSGIGGLYRGIADASIRSLESRASLLEDRSSLL